AAIRNSPPAFEFVVRIAPVSRLLTVTLASLTAAPEGSSTFPEIDAVTWAMRVAWVAINPKITTDQPNRCARRSPCLVRRCVFNIGSHGSPCLRVFATCKTQTELLAVYTNKGIGTN